MVWTLELRDFIRNHQDDDTAELLLAAARWPDIDVPAAVEQIEARRRLKGKLPEWWANPDLIMGGRVPAEQCSSEVTARYKSVHVLGDSAVTSICDMTGGMGVDFWYMSEGMKRAIYTERNEELCSIAKHNFQVLMGNKPNGSPHRGGDACQGREGLEVRCGDGRELPIPSVDIIYLDPARRAGDGSRVYAMEDCEPNIVEWQDELLRHAKMVLVKLSPMVDLTDVLRKLKGVTDIHIVAVKNECKEVLIKQAQAHALGDSSHAECVMVHCVDFVGENSLRYTAKFPDEMEVPVLEQGVGHYLYEPDVTLMKAQLFGSLCQRFSVHQLEIGTHLMTSDELVPDFPGRIFVVEEQLPFSSKLLKRLKKAIPQANIATRNFILSADQLRHRAGIKDGGDIYLFGAKVKGQGDVLLRCRKQK